ncbi:shikimate dehydrogenase [Pelagibacterium lentulum]|uniref:Shikimate dehydrogenase (NADP(+)) n=1 Tax=Pelagibacterium lentulum TaxID=2029865 RepID=A0A916VUX7_9HYPH|nr:shikimate dehydrogenase [Pelagibacterium lentulum]GGA37405.1 shikimate dehydrogenase (NADP(+)) [Pelagibacterium lentulum]
MKKAFVIGHPIAHSLSPKIHSYWLDHYGIAGSYEAIDVAPDELAAFLDRLRLGQFVGGNVTIPHKEAVMSLCDVVDPRAATIGAVNTLVVGESGISGSNTDEPGFLANLDQNAPGWDRHLEVALVLGAGGAARAIIAGLHVRGARHIHVLNRSPERAEALRAEMGDFIVPGALSSFNLLAPSAQIVVNTSAVGMKGSRFDGLDLTRLEKSTLVTDAVYTPLMTPLLADAQAIGLHIVDGLGMLLHQAVPGFEAWFGHRPQVSPALRNHILRAMGQ